MKKQNNMFHCRFNQVLFMAINVISYDLARVAPLIVLLICGLVWLLVWKQDFVYLCFADDKIITFAIRYHMNWVSIV